MAKHEYHYPLGSHENWQEDAAYKHQDSQRNKLVGTGLAVFSSICGALAIEAFIADQPLAGVASVVATAGTAYVAKERFDDARTVEETARHYDTLAVHTRED